jgi:hypothetical protein
MRALGMQEFSVKEMTPERRGDQIRQKKVLSQFTSPRTKRGTQRVITW